MDREKVVKGVESCIKMGRLGIENCRELNCPYFENGLRLSCWIDVLNDALELLKKQQEEIDFLTVESGSNAELAEGYAELLKAKDPVKPKIERALYDYQSWYYVCGACDRGIDIQDHFCRHCGRKIDHERKKT